MTPSQSVILPIVTRSVDSSLILPLHGATVNFPLIC